MSEDLQSEDPISLWTLCDPVIINGVPQSNVNAPYEVLDNVRPIIRVLV